MCSINWSLSWKKRSQNGQSFLEDEDGVTAIICCSSDGCFFLKCLFKLFFREKKISHFSHL